MPLKKVGGIRVHGPLCNCCTGSGMRLVPQALDNSCSTEPLSPLVADNTPSELIFSADIHKSTQVLKQIPQASRHLAATKLAGALDDVTNKNDSGSLKHLFKFASSCFDQPHQGGHCRSLISTVKRMLEVEADPVMPRITGQHSRFRLFNPMESLAKPVLAKHEDSVYGGAVRIACSEDAIVDSTPDTLNALLEKTPMSSPRFLSSISSNTWQFCTIFLNIGR